MLNWKRHFAGLMKPLEGKQPEPKVRTELVKPRPQSLRERYCYLATDDLVDMYFQRLHHRVYREIDRYHSVSHLNDRVHKRILRENGRLGNQRPYFFLQPVNSDGWLFEKDTHGWRVTRAQKIVSQKTFMRQYESWDVVTLHTNDDAKGPPRVDSQRFKADLVSYAVYEQQLLDALGLGKVS